jgi:hypothetical protein
MIHHYQTGESLQVTRKTPKSRKQRLVTTKLDTELLNQMYFLAQHLETKQVEILRHLVKKKIHSLGLWNEYLSSPKKYQDNDLK